MTADAAVSNHHLHIVCFLFEADAAVCPIGIKAADRQFDNKLQTVDNEEQEAERLQLLLGMNSLMTLYLHGEFLSPVSPNDDERPESHCRKSLEREMPAVYFLQFDHDLLIYFFNTTTNQLPAAADG